METTCIVDAVKEVTGVDFIMLILMKKLLD